MKKVVTILLAMALIISLFSACGGAKQSAETADQKSGTEGSSDAGASTEPVKEAKPITITITSYYSDEVKKGLVAEAIKECQAKLPNVTYEHNALDWNDYQATIKTAFDSGVGSDIVLLDDTQQQLMHKHNYLLDITNYVIEKKWLERTNPGAVEFNNRRTPGKYYSVPNIMSTLGVFYNKDIFAELNVQPPKTFDEFNDIMYKARDAGYIAMENGGIQCYHLQWAIFLMIYGSVPAEDIHDWYFMRETKPNFVKAFKNALSYIAKWAKDGCFRENMLSIDINNVPALFGEGKSAMVIDGSWDISMIDKANVNTGVFMFPPMDPSLPPYTVSATYGAWSLNAQIPEEKKDAAIEYIDTLLSPEQSLRWFEAGNHVAAKFDVSKANVKPLFAEFAQASQGYGAGAFLDNALPGQLDYITKLIQQLVLGEIDVEEYWEKLNEKYEQLKPQYAN